MRTTQVCQVKLYISLYDNCAMAAPPQCNKLLYHISDIVHHMSHSFLYNICAMVAPTQCNKLYRRFLSSVHYCNMLCYTSLDCIRPN